MGETLIINPGLLVKGNSPGSFVRITTHPVIRNLTDEERNEAAEKIEPHRVAERTRVDIFRI